MSVTMKMTGFRDIEKALAQLPAGTAKGVARRAMKKELAPVAATANAFWPGSSDDVFQITSKIAAGQRGDSVAQGGRSVLNMYVGAPGGRFGTPEAHLVEFGTGPRFQKNGRFTGSVAPQPMLQPAWDMHKQQLLEGLGQRLWEEITKTIERRAKRAAKG
ncbi:hypothetical protein JF540_12985 [Salipiger thiooxidans]|uniref:hypothetical protein n=1 Tax=Salipiger thiooxidans TaxID=282683 RepID=UPI001A904254|nr:hypothetical protein [Salipiger thiooxidans]MBN8187606.1 hypothetical protein [Salipiger thiooxidans]